MIRVFLVLPLFLLSSCSVYKSAVRKEFENRSAGRTLSSIATTGHCEVIGPFTTWIEKEFSGGPLELVHAEADLEVWKRTQSSDSGEIEIRGFRALSQTQTLACRHSFGTEADWQEIMPDYFDFLDQSALD